MSDSKLEYVAGAREKPCANAPVDIIFVHGLTGDLKGTWTHSNGEFWPSWLAADFPAANVYSAGYDSSVFSSFMKGGGASLADRATILLDRLASRPSRGRPILFITHSLGGLIVKQMLRKSLDASSERHKAIGRSTVGVIFIATPHQGAEFAKAVNRIIGLATTKTIRELERGGDQLVDLGIWFSNWAGKSELNVECYYEVEKTKTVLVVDQTTANPNVLGCDPVAIQADHISITKLVDRDAQLYQSISTVITDLLATTAASDDSGGGGDAVIESEYNAFTSQAPSDRRTLAEKLTATGRQAEIVWAEKQKERFSMTLQRNIAQPSAVRQYTRLMSNIETRYRRYVGPLIADGTDGATIDHALQESVLDPCLKAHDADGGEGTSGLVDSAFYYLAGNCHVSWDNG
ncbi:ABC-three component system protein [Caulobacter sp. UNC279MFTsu5.1]|uniref:ABC-three component system protein n=1 Tax=Caulobacter sp. UNC279MFTsu5.1 TaxID=1502775 RepID=UPI00039DA3DA|nr:ABC-three component system protein [Caulobacter sp. UNC279MFTsu5.1]SFI56003.1 Putative serine esterase [Caulobacter sp. UNC279MFTsu5.1]